MTEQPLHENHRCVPHYAGVKIDDKQGTINLYLTGA